MNTNLIKISIDRPQLRKLLNTALFNLDSRLGRAVNITGMLVIAFSVVLSMVGTLDVITEEQSNIVGKIEISVTLFFTLEYFLRLIAANKPVKYALSFYGLIDLLTWLPLFIFGDVNLAIRLLRVMRLLKLIRYLRALHLFLSSLEDTIDSLLVVACAILIIILIAGNVIHAIEPETFPDAFIGSWWGLVTMTTVGYGDMVPQTGVGKVIAAVLMITGITMIAMLTATISVKIAGVINNDKENEFSSVQGYCLHCGIKQKDEPYQCLQCGHHLDKGNDHYCAKCGHKAPETRARRSHRR